jgi:septal ring factor EnvC (AmiA/AmiB activator)
MSIERKLIEIKEAIEAAEQKLNKLQVKEEFLLSQLKDDWQCNLVEEAENYLSKLRNKNDKISQEIEEGMANLEKMMVDENL